MLWPVVRGGPICYEVGRRWERYGSRGMVVSIDAVGDGQSLGVVGAGTKGLD